MNQLPIDTICLLPTVICTRFWTQLDKIDGDKIVLIAEDDIDCGPAMKKRVHQILEDKKWQSFGNSWHWKSNSD